MSNDNKLTASAEAKALTAGEAFDILMNDPSLAKPREPFGENAGDEVPDYLPDEQEAPSCYLVTYHDGEPPTLEPCYGRAGIEAAKIEASGFQSRGVDCEVFYNSSFEGVKYWGEPETTPDDDASWGGDVSRFDCEGVPF